MINRRTFLKRALTAVAVSAVLPPLLQGCGRGIRRSDLVRPPLQGESLGGLSPDAVAILWYASLAPSGHNAQPWTVRPVKEDEWVIGADPARALSAVDPKNREGLLSIGAFAENLDVAAGALGYEAHMTVVAENPTDRDVIRVRLTKVSPRPYPLERLEARRTVKHGQENRELRSEDVRVLFGKMEDRFFYFPGGTSHAECIREGAVDCFRIQSGRDDAQKELSEWVRFKDRKARQLRDGLTPEGMEIGGFAGWYVRHFMGPEDVLTQRFREQGVDAVAEQAGEGAGWFILNGKGQSVPDLIETGRQFERMALRARERSVGIHPMTQILEEEAGRRLIAENHPPELVPQFVLRVGYVSPYPDPVSLRRPVGWFVAS